MCLITIMSATFINKGAYKHKIIYYNKFKKVIVDFFKVEK